MGRGINKSCVWGEEICGPGTVVPLIHENLFVSVDKLVQVS